MRICSVVILSFFLFAGCGDGISDEEMDAYEKAQALQTESKYREALEIYETILDEYPETKLAPMIEENINLCETMDEVERKSIAMKAVNDLKMLARACERFRMRNGCYPSSLNSLVHDYVERIPLDPWSHKYEYRVENVGRRKSAKYFLASFGKDGLPGGEQENFDLIVKDGEFAEKHIWLK